LLGIKGGGTELFEGRLKARLRRSQNTSIPQPSTFWLHRSRAFRRPQRLLRRAEWMSLRKMKIFEIYQ